jgi:SnoaL-like domain
VSDLISTVDTWLSAYGEPDSERRAELIGQVWAADGRLVDPPLAATGHEGIGDMAAAVQEQFPRHRFRRISGIDEHHDAFRFAWELLGPDGAVAVSGTDFGELAADGRLRQITGFFGELPAREDA